jgi:hypothetical protein
MPVKFKQIGHFNLDPKFYQQRVDRALKTELENIQAQLMLWLRLAVKDKWRPEPQYDENGQQLPQPPYLLSPEQYLGCVVPAITQTANGWSLEISIKDGVHQPSGRSWTELHMIREYGSAELKLPPVPIWRPLWLKFRSHWPSVKLDLGKMVKEVLK